MKTLVVALGGNALLQRGEALTAENQYRNIASAVPATGASGAHISRLLSMAMGRRLACFRYRISPGRRSSLIH